MQKNQNLNQSKRQKRKTNVPKTAPKSKQGAKAQQKIDIRQVATSNNKLVTDVRALVLAQGVLENIQVEVIPNQAACYGAQLGLVSLAMSRGANNPYALYSILYQDFADLLNGGQGKAPSRIRYMNKIYNAFTPKNVPFRLKGSLGYKFASINPAAPPPTYVVRSKIYYNYVFDDNVVGQWFVQSPPPVYSDTELSTYYNAGMTAIAGRAPHTRFTRDLQLEPEYKSDSSAYARNSRYYGDGNSVGGPFGSAEAEVPFKSPLLSVLTTFDTTVSRSSRKLKVTSGDSTSNIAIGSLEQFPTSYYNGAVPPIYKFLDLSEFAYLICNTLTTALNFMTTTPNVSYEVALTNGIACTYSQFLIMLRQQVLAMFADSQCLAQFIVPDEDGTGAFEAFRCGSNCFPLQQATKMLLTQFANENLKCLKMVVREYTTRQYQNSNNHVVHIPVWGMFKNSAPLEFTYLVRNPDTEGPAYLTRSLFLPESGDEPDIWDGTYNGQPADFNFSPIVNTIVQDWNYFMGTLSPMFSSIEMIGGDGCGSPFLQFTRYVKFRNNDFKAQAKEKKCYEIDERAEARLPKSLLKFIETRTEEVVTMDQKRASKKEMRTFKVYNPPNSTVYTEYTEQITGYIPITASHRQYLPGLLLPIIEIGIGDELPAFPEVQVSSLEPYRLPVNASGHGDVLGTIYGTRASELDARLPDEVSGLASRKTGIASFVSKLSDADQGGFLGDLFATAGAIATTLGAPGVGGALKGASGIANLVGI